MPRPSDLAASTALAIAVISRTNGNEEYVAAAESLIEITLSTSTATPLAFSQAHAAQANLALHAGDVHQAKYLYDVLLPQQGTVTHDGIESCDRLLRELAATLRRHEQAASHFEEGNAFCRKAGYISMLAWCLHYYAEMLLDSVGAGFKPAPTPEQRTRATSLLDEALQISSDLGMRPLMARALSRREILEA